MAMKTTRRQVLKALTAATAAPAILTSTRAYAANPTIRIGHVSPRTSSGAAKKVAGLFPNDADGNAWGHPELGFPAPLQAGGFELVDPGRYQPLNDDFSNYISAFKEAGCEIVTGNMIPPDFATFWSQAAQQGFQPKVVTIGKALLFPSVIESLGERGNGLTSEIWWTPSHPFSSSLSGESAKTLADGYTAATGRPWTQPIGFKHALFEVTRDVLTRAEDLDDPAAIVQAIKSTNVSTIVGDVVVTTNDLAPQIPLGGTLQLLS